MRDEENPAAAEHDALPPSDSADTGTPPLVDQAVDSDNEGYDEGLVDEIVALIDDGRTYAEAEIAFQKTRGKLAGRGVGKAIAFAAVALITLHIAVLALAVGLVIALEPLVTIWGAIAIVVGMLLLVTAILVMKAKASGEMVGSLFSSGEDGSST
ncbi:phage holin family protein [Erythrobacter sp. THAF29]|uniref:phage holin family protein n=1 Tax=Erythrobacter sp. THAF29 TaxID=2587851 RepID=UPI001267ACCB|nr:phage holin family protein [Erythrobacter sp. THAF29]QFT77815.1 hypothetical protein FIU90_09735 [Erythrobacter sp. THAF29]